MRNTRIRKNGAKTVRSKSVFGNFAVSGVRNINCSCYPRATKRRAPGLAEMETERVRSC